ncbi:hypothetical protein SAMN04487865_1001101 [Succinivibrio dextrinosolvens]|uniref:Uncharacterized protein n=1 Tax=Succinivibrio dextrinosolvens TaxID=83771 RepID=A0A662Z656_9GAMM|nr:hypothetical protein SAMN04487865_1001101 [Succinivibrio dextrinosolvens]
MLGPNIKGTCLIQQAGGASVSGAIFSTGMNYATPNASSRVSLVNGINASLYNSVYTDSGHVYSLSLVLNFIIKT